MTDFVVAVGLTLAIEGCLYAAAPAAMKRGLRAMLAVPDGQLRIGGVVVMAAGVAVVWLMRH